MTLPSSNSPQPIVCRRSFRRIAHFAAALPHDLADSLWRDPETLVGHGEQLRENAARCTVRIEWNGTPYVLKHSIEPTLRHAVRQLIRPSRAWTTWQFTHRLADAGVATPRPVACVENVWGQLRRDSYLMYPYMEGRTLRSIFVNEARQLPELHARLWRQVHELWQQLLALGVSLGDTNLGNFIVSPDGRLWLIDLDKSRFHRTASAAAPHQQRAWNQLLRSAKKCGALSAAAAENRAA